MYLKKITLIFPTVPLSILSLTTNIIKASDLSGCGNDINEAKDSMEKTLMIYFDYALNKNTLLKDLRNHGWNVRGVKQKKIKAPKFDDLLHNEDFLDILENKEYQKFDTPVEIPV